MPREDGLPREVFQDYWDRLVALGGTVEHTQSFTPDLVHRMLLPEAQRNRPLIVETTMGPGLSTHGEPCVRRVISQAGWELLGKPDHRSA